jgi:amino acid adenylation domain-containing protein
MRFLYSGFLASAQSAPGRPALNVNGQTVTYGELREQAMRIAASIQRRGDDESKLTAVFADRSLTGFAGILGALLAGHGYVPLNPNFPVARTQRMLTRAGCSTVIVDATALPQLDAILQDAPRPLVVILPDPPNASSLAGQWHQHTFVAADDLEAAFAWQDTAPAADDIAYLLFTSGSTGEPKGVPVTHGSVVHFLDAMAARYDFAPEDRFSQMFDSTFDLSVFDMFVAWQSGACVYCPPRATLLNPDAFVREHALTVWFSVPSLGLMMQRLGSLKPGRFPSLRWSLFCGEALPQPLVESWAQAAPASTIDNLYGPTELTVACTAYRWDPSSSPADCVDGIVPIGEPLLGMTARVVDEAREPVAEGQIGELLMAGPQRTPGYLNDPAATARAHVRVPGAVELFYRTGDRVRMPHPGKPMTYVGRVDQQIEVMGHRVELGEVELALRQEPGVDGAVALPWPLTAAGASGIAAFVTGQALDPSAIRSSVRAKLQGYAVPQTIEVLAAFPQNASGKVDRQALLRMLSA